MLSSRTHTSPGSPDTLPSGLPRKHSSSWASLPYPLSSAWLNPKERDFQISYSFKGISWTPSWCKTLCWVFYEIHRLQEPQDLERERQQHRRGSGECVHTWEPRKDSKGQGSQFPLWRLDIRADKSTEATEMQLHFYCEFSMHKEAVACFLSVGIMFHSRYDGYIYMAAWLGHGVPRYSVKHLPKYSVEHYSECVWEGVSGWD